MDRRRKILVNRYEELTNEALLRAAKKFGAHVFPKVRIADAMDINRSGLNDQEYSYALKAHFDFIVTEKDLTVSFAVEFDEAYHKLGTDAALKDELKNSICSKLGLPLLRMTSEYLKAVGRFPSLVGWLVEIYFLCEGFYAAQQEGQIPDDEPWLWFSVLGYDPFISSRAFIQKTYSSGGCLQPKPEIIRTNNQKGHLESALAILNVGDNQYLIGFAQCAAVKFYAVPPSELCEELAILAVSEDLDKFQRNQLKPYSLNEVAQWKVRMRQAEKRDRLL